MIDGDTFESIDGRIFRLANVNSPEPSSKLSSKAKDYLKEYENKTVSIEIIEEDIYDRLLVRAYGNSYINLESVSQGFSSKFLVYSNEVKLFGDSEKKAIINGIGIWNHSIYWGCFNIQVYPEEEYVQIENFCNLDLSGFYIKDESRKIYKFLNISSNIITLYTKDGVDTKEELFWSSTNVWNNDRDSAYLFDEKDNLAGYYSYGY